MNRIKLKFEVERKHFGKPRIEKEAIELAWVDSASTRIDTLYVQVYNQYNHKIFHTFLTTETFVHNVPLRIHDEPAHYQVHAYGLKLCRESSTLVLSYVIQNAAMSALSSLLIKGEDLERLILVPNFEYEKMKDLEQSSYGIDVEPHLLTEYVFTGFKERAFYVIFLHQLHPQNTYILVKLGNGVKRATIPFHLQPACEFSFQCFLVEKGNETSFLGRSHSTMCKFRTRMVKENVQELFEKATSFIYRHINTYSQLTHFYRNKSFAYFENIMQTTDGLMAKYLKNWGGDQSSTLNRTLKGLFFSAHVDPKTKFPPSISYYGPKRLYIPTQLLLNDDINLYFSDFYCHYKNHKVQLVITLKGSDSDHFCEKRILKLDPYNNPFWKTLAGYLFVTTKITVEVFFTENIPIKIWQQWYEGIHFEDSTLIGNASNTTNGIPKNAKCKICNLDHVMEATAALHNLI